jgi:hypothetical protein
MTWQPVDPQQGPQRGPQSATAWEQDGSSLLPSPARAADRITTILLLAFGALMTIVAALVTFFSLIGGIASCDASRGCSPGEMIGGAALGVGGAFVIGVATVVLSIGAWLRRRSSWWIAAIGFVLAVGLLVWGGVLFADAVTNLHGASQRLGYGFQSN